MRLARPLFLLLMAPALLASLAGAWGGAPTEVFDPARDVAVYRNGFTVPVDSIDVLHAALDDADGAIRGASLRLVDLERMGFENALFVRQHPHTMRAWGFVSFLEDRSALTAIAVKYDPPMGEWDLGAVALRLRPDGTYDEVPVTFSLDAARDAATWTFGTPVPVRPSTFAAFAGMTGCDGPDECDTTPRGSSADGAPDGGSAYLASVQTFAWWSDVFPADEEPSPLHEARKLLVETWTGRPRP